MYQTQKGEKKVDQKLTETAVKLARMYGVAETLMPLAYASNEEVTEKILAWAREYQASEQTDLVRFFEEKMKEAGTLWGFPLLDVLRGHVL